MIEWYLSTFTRLRWLRNVWILLALLDPFPYHNHVFLLQCRFMPHFICNTILFISYHYWLSRAQPSIKIPTYPRLLRKIFKVFTTKTKIGKKCRFRVIRSFRLFNRYEAFIYKDSCWFCPLDVDKLIDFVQIFLKEHFFVIKNNFLVVERKQGIWL